MTNFLKKFWFIILTCLVAIILRLYKLEELFYFSYDEAIPSFVGKNLYQLHKIPLIGGVTPFGVHLTPYFYWLLAFILVIANLNPIAWGIMSAVFSAVTVFLIYLVGRDFFNKKVGLFAAIIWSFSYLANLYDRHFWALYWGPVLCLATLLSLKRILEGNKRYLILLSIIFIWSISTDPSNLMFILLSVGAYALFKIRVTKKEVYALIVVLLSLLPLVFFDLRHNFANTKPVVQYLKADKSVSRFDNQGFIDRSAIFLHAFTRLTYPFSDNEVAKQYTYCPSFIHERYNKIPLISTFALAAALFCFLFFSFKSKHREKSLITLAIILYFLGIQSYGALFNGDIYEHYLTGLFPIFLLIVAFYVSKLPQKLGLLLLAIFIFTNLFKLSNAQNNHGLKYKKQAVQYVSNEMRDESFSLDSLSTCWKYSGYRYLFASFGTEPVKSYVDPNLGYLYGNTEIAQKHPETVVAFITHDFLTETPEFYNKYALYKSHEVKNDIFGNIEVIVMDNSLSWF